MDVLDWCEQFCCSHYAQAVLSEEKTDLCEPRFSSSAIFWCSNQMGYKLMKGALIFLTFYSKNYFMASLKLQFFSASFTCLFCLYYYVYLLLYLSLLFCIFVIIFVFIIMNICYYICLYCYVYLSLLFCI